MSSDRPCFFFKQKTAYEMRISDWSSDVCSSDLVRGAEDILRARFAACGRAGDESHRLFAAVRREEDEAEIILRLQMPLLGGAALPGLGLIEIGRAAAAELVRPAVLELRIGVARDREPHPLGARRRLTTATAPCRKRG